MRQEYKDFDGRTYEKDPTQYPLFVHCTDFKFRTKFSSEIEEDQNRRVILENSIHAKGRVDEEVLSVLGTKEFNDVEVEVYLNTTNEQNFLNQGWKSRCFYLHKDEEIVSADFGWCLHSYIPDEIFNSLQNDFYEYGISDVKLEFELDFWTIPGPVADRFLYLENGSHAKGFLRDIQWIKGPKKLNK